MRGKSSLYWDLCIHIYCHYIHCENTYTHYVPILRTLINVDQLVQRCADSSGDAALRTTLWWLLRSPVPRLVIS